MAVPTFYGAFVSNLYPTTGLSVFSGMIWLFFSHKPDIVTDLTTNIYAVFATNLLPDFPFWLIPYYDTIVWICPLVARLLPMASKILTFLKMSIYLLSISHQDARFTVGAGMTTA